MTFAGVVAGQIRTAIVEHVFIAAVTPVPWLQHLWRTSDTSGTRVVLREGSEVLVRAVQTSDAPLLAEGFTRLGGESRRLRFLTGKPALSLAELHYLTDVDHHDHEALGALQLSDGRGVGVARYVRLAGDPDAAEVAVTVVDDWQDRGLGTELLRQLADRARQEGVLRFRALVAADNAAVVGLLHDAGARVRTVHEEGGAVEYEIDLLSPGSYAVLQALLRALGRRQLRPPDPLQAVLHTLVPARFAVEAVQPP